jgi:hypothetical protein
MDLELQFTSNRIVDNEDLFEIIENNTNITEVLDLENSKSLITVIDEEKIEESNHYLYSSNISISLASAVTAYARIYMSHIKMKYKDSLYYSDTDSAFLDCELDPKFIGTGLGLWKLEYDLKEAIFLAPKVYGCLFKDKKELVKVKGFKNLVTFKKLKSLLKKDSSLNLNQEKWFKNLAKGEITIIKQIYKLTATSNKRELIYKNKKLVGTKPYFINNAREIKE